MKKKKQKKVLIPRMGPPKNLRAAQPFEPKAEKKDEEQRKRQLREGDWDAL